MKKRSKELNEDEKLALRNEAYAIKLFEKRLGHSRIYGVDNDSWSELDGVIIENDKIRGVVEVKSRLLTLDQIKEYGTLLLTHKKLMKGREVSSIFKVPFYLLIYLTPEDLLLVYQITDEEGDYKFDFEVEKTRVKRSQRGGIAYRDNAFLPIEAISEAICGDAPTHDAAIFARKINESN